ncbi:Uncharacterized conserved protein YggL, DUF469 family [Gulbenkiania indica]|uniref:Uncharacterized conserved protein YggL, DUF469 family n=1 Tax=Gulbenkiania indica TaxID=375574 RepID=A0A0K6GZW1_9NEIS|nr:YggL family protein [Gulbenkiania indica]CUA84096.1 Uncharacterized conserved protein YggL, DUF469 family [Gulbenkiania indica]
MSVRNPHSPNRLKRLKPRQRKKMHVGEFSELGFHLVATLAESKPAEALDALLDAWLTEVERHGVSFGGHFDGRSHLEGVVFPVGDTKVSEEVRTALVGWLGQREEVENVEAGELIDLWHSQY